VRLLKERAGSAANRGRKGGGQRTKILHPEGWERRGIIGSLGVAIFYLRGIESCEKKQSSSTGGSKGAGFSRTLGRGKGRESGLD